MSKVVIGLTGPTGAGKSTVAAALEKAGCRIIDADRIAHDAVMQPECIIRLKAEYGADIMKADGSLNRRLLAQRAFSTPEKSARLNEITHPIIMDEILDRIAREQQSDAKAIVLDAPLLFESGADHYCTATISVTAPIELRLSRVMNRDSITLELAKARIGAQHDDVYYDSRADYVFDGAAAAEGIPEKAQKILERILGDVHEKV